MVAFATAACLASCYQSQEVLIVAGSTDSSTDSDADSDIDTDADADTDSNQSSQCQGDNVWLDQESGLCWQDIPEQLFLTWLGADDYCLDLVLDGQDDWYLPSIDELRSLVRGCGLVEPGGECQIVDGSGEGEVSPWCEGCMPWAGPGQEGTYLDPAVEKVGSTRLWSSSVYNDPYDHAWTLRYSTGEILGIQVSHQLDVRCVRLTEP